MVVSADEHRLRLSPEQPDQNSQLGIALPPAYPSLHSRPYEVPTSAAQPDAAVVLVPAIREPGGPLAASGRVVLSDSEANRAGDPACGLIHMFLAPAGRRYTMRATYGTILL